MIIKGIYKKARRFGISFLENGKEFNSIRYKAGSKFSLKRKKRWKNDYGLQNEEKNKFRLFYGIKEKQLRNMFKEAKKSTSSNLTKDIFEMAESRLDNLIFKSGIAKTRNHARKLVSHAFFETKKEGKKIKPIKSPSYRVSTGEMISFKENKNKMKNNLKKNLSEKNSYIEEKIISIDNDLNIKYLKKPELKEKMKFDIKKIAEWYDKIL